MVRGFAMGKALGSHWLRLSQNGKAIVLAWGQHPPYVLPMTDFQDDNRLGGRLSRYARVTGAVGGLAVQYAASRVLGTGLDNGRHARELKAALGGLKGPVMKVAQILSTIPDALPPEYAQELAQLQANAPAMGWPFVRRRMKSELGEGWQDRFASFDQAAVAAASLGQVHRAAAHDGTALAVKLQYPDMASAVEADLRQLDVLLSIFRNLDRSIDPANIRAELADRLREELDYAREARHMALYRHMLQDEPAVRVPQSVPDLSTGRLLSMQWLDGRPLLDFKQADLETRNSIAINLFRAWYVPFHQFGVIHGDPHLGNYTVREDLGINLLDFGCIRVFSPAFVGGVIDLYRALRDGDRDLAASAYRGWGFEGLSNEMIDVLNVWASFIYGPLLEDSARLINSAEKPGDYGRETAARVHGELKKLGTVRPPREFLFMDRAAVGLGGVFLHLRAEVNWYQLFHQVIEGFSIDTMAAKQLEALRLVGLGESPQAS
jgi:predicted unusual protein kinase regulating ubiquinone biosynthesis (AarF/ABC1/UbiB family)